MIFGSNPGFIFHDSCGFEAGDTADFNMVRQFIEERSKARNVNERLHVIWCVRICLSKEHISHAENKSFE